LIASLDPLRPAVFVVVLRSRFVNALAFLVGWTLALTLLFFIVSFALAGDVETGPSDALAAAASVFELAIGVALIALAAHRWRHAASEFGYPQAIQRQLERLDVRRSAGLGVLIQPRALTIAAALVVARDRSSVISWLIGFAVFAFASTAAILAILIFVLRRPDRAAAWLTELVTMLERQAANIFTILCAAAGCYLVIDGIVHLT